MRIFKQKGGLISKNDLWVCICEGYLYTANSKDDLISLLNREWKHCKHLIG